MDEGTSTADDEYADRLARLQKTTWKQVLHVQLPWQLHLRSLKLGRTLDVGCGIGRNLLSLAPGSVGVDHNEKAIRMARDIGATAYTTDEYFASPELSAPHSYDSMLVAHVLEHLTPELAREVIGSYLPQIKPGGRVVWITPQERGYASDATHLTFVDFDFDDRLAEQLHVTPVKRYSFPFPRWAGRAFIYNEFVYIGTTPTE